LKRDRNEANQKERKKELKEKRKKERKKELEEKKERKKERTGGKGREKFFIPNQGNFILRFFPF